MIASRIIVQPRATLKTIEATLLYQKRIHGWSPGPIKFLPSVPGPRAWPFLIFPYSLLFIPPLFCETTEYLVYPHHI